MNDTPEAAIRAVIDGYLAGIRTANGDGLRSMFDPSATVTHLHVKSGAVRSIGLEQFIAEMGTLHAKFDNAEEKAEEIDVTIVDHIASVRVKFSFVMGARAMSGQDLFTLALSGGSWKIVHKSYYL